MEDVVCSHGESISGGIQGNTTALMYKMRARERDQGNVHQLIALLCVSILTVR